jgi:hypothetical protein
MKCTKKIKACAFLRKSEVVAAKRPWKIIGL